MRFAIPVLVLAVLIGVFYVGLHHDPREIPSPLIGKPAPAFDLQTLEQSPARLATADLHGKPRVVNFFASWCEGCQVEHPLFLQLARQTDAEIIGIDYKDTPENVNDWLKRLGNPYAVVAQDVEGTAGIDWGVYGVPETFILDAQGTIVFKQVGPMTLEVWNTKVKPLLAVPAPGNNLTGKPS
jgi:cytochrome c biogenesis protein CcmG/thiol:disulfide interchange protein DsbE